MQSKTGGNTTIEIISRRADGSVKDHTIIHDSGLEENVNCHE